MEHERVSGHPEPGEWYNRALGVQFQSNKSDTTDPSFEIAQFLAISAPRTPRSCNLSTRFASAKPESQLFAETVS